MTAKEFDDYIEELNSKGIVLGMDTITRLLDAMGNPQDELKFIHIAGTNGKGSILAFTSTILTKAGMVVGRYLSPVIFEYREKIQVNGRNISKKDMLEGMGYIKTITDQMKEQGQPLPTLFEVETALAFWYFAKKKCDLVVLETGLGGRDDATNIVSTTLIEAFARISRDHMAILGETLSEIAEIKAGIIKRRTIVITAEQDKEVEKVLGDITKDMESTLVKAKPASKYKPGLKVQTFDYEEYKKLKITLAGTWQVYNATVAIEIIKALRSIGYEISDDALYKGLEATCWPGRFNIIHEKPLIIMDGAHNEDASIRLRESVETHLKGHKLVFVVGVLKDKEYEKVLGNMLDLAEAVVTLTPPNNKRALPAIDLANAAKKYNSNVTCADSVEEAVEIASLLAGKNCDIIAFGSLSYLGRFEQAVKTHLMGH